jgi:flagellar biosynthesis GTPase FlhF
MTELFEKHYSIDPGIGKKMDGCPYSNYEDGRDVKDYIIPPKGYVFSGFRFDPDAKNQIYDGRLIALYSKEPFKIRLKSNMWKFLLAAIIVVVIGLIVLLATNVFKGPKSQNSTSKEPKTEVTTQPSKLEQTDNSLSKTTKRNKKSRKEKKKDKKDKSDSNTPKTDNNITDQSKQEPVVKSQEPEAKPQETMTQTQEPVKPAATNLETNFNQEFWDLIHQRTFSMDAYHDLYTNYKGKVEGEEYNYLRYTILQDYASYKAWYENLKKIPESQLQSINSIDELKKRIP